MAAGIPVALVLFVCGPLAAALRRARGRARRAEQELARLREQHRAQAMRDPLTGLLGEPALREHLVRAAAHARRRVEPISVLLVEVRGLQEARGRYGPQGAEELLRTLAECMRATLRAEDVYGRFSGERFLVILAGTIGVQAEIVSERLRALAGRAQPAGDLPRGIELDVGCATAIRATPEGLLETAEAQLRRLGAQRSDRRARALGA